MPILEIFESLAAAGLVRSQMEFSTIWLGRSPRYFSHLLAVRREPGIATLLGLAHRMERIGTSLTDTSYNTLLTLSRQITDTCSRRTITDIRKRKSFVPER